MMPRMTRPQPVRFARTESTMAYPDGRLLALREERLYVLAVDGWSAIGHGRPAGAQWLVRQEAEQWCAAQGVGVDVLDEVPS